MLVSAHLKSFLSTEIDSKINFVNEYFKTLAMDLRSLGLIISIVCNEIDIFPTFIYESFIVVDNFLQTNFFELKKIGEPFYSYFPYHWP